MTIRILAFTGETSKELIPNIYKCLKNSCNIKLKIKAIHYTKQIKLTMQTDVLLCSAVQILLQEIKLTVVRPDAGFHR